MKALTIKGKIILWFSALIFVIVGLMFSLILLIGNSVIQSDAKSRLIEMVESNTEEVEYYDNMGKIDLDEGDHYIQYLSGYLEIDDDFCDLLNGIYTALYSPDNVLLYGENPIAFNSAPKYQDNTVQVTTVNGQKYFVYDRQLVGPNLDGLWLRGIVSEQEGTSLLAAIIKFSMLLFPLLAILAIFGGYIIAKRSLKPIEQISNAAEEISEGKDLSKRIALGKGSDEIHRLADTFDNMFDRLETAFEAERQFTSDASHELRTPTSVILAECEYALEKPQTQKEYVEALEVIQRQGLKMSKLITQLLAFARLEQKTQMINKAEVNLSSLLQDICQEQALISSKGITISTQIAENIYANIDKDLFTQLLINLINNSFRYGKENGTTTVTLNEDASAIILTVQDNGIGIAPENLNKIWQRFYQVNQARNSDHNGGAGLGLAMVQEIAHIHGATISVESMPDAGSTFTISIPKNK